MDSNIERKPSYRCVKTVSWYDKDTNQVVGSDKLICNDTACMHKQHCHTDDIQDLDELQDFWLNSDWSYVENDKSKS